MKFALLKQATIIPLAVMLTPILCAFFLPGYSSVSQHISELELLPNPLAVVQRTSVIVASLSIALFGLGLWRAFSGRMAFTAATAAVTGLSFASNGVFVMGSPLHGLYGLGGFSMVLLPAFFAAEAEHVGAHGAVIRRISLIVTAIVMAYLWLMLAGFDPARFRGLTQRFITVTYFGWLSLAALWLSRRATGTFLPREPGVEQTAGAG